MDVLDTLSLPCEVFGDETSRREVRLAASPFTTGEERVTLVLTMVDPNCVAAGHIHPDADEYIFFDIGGKMRLDGEEFDVAPKGLVHARSGVWHECVNTSATEKLTLYCIFVPPFAPYGSYPALIEKTNAFLQGKGER